MSTIGEGILLGALVTMLARQGDRETEKRIEAMERRILELINEERRKEGVEPLKSDDALARAARKHSERMVREDFFDHTDKQGKGPADRVNAEKYRWSRVGENIALNSGYKDPAEYAVAGWMKSSGHRRNILDSNFTETGIGIATDGKKFYFTQVFARPAR